MLQAHLVSIDKLDASKSRLQYLFFKQYIIEQHPTMYIVLNFYF